MIRNAAVAGKFYPAEKKELLKELDGMIPCCERKINTIGIVAPHAGYMYSGHVAGGVYARLNPSSTYIIISPNHTGDGASFAVSDENWITPLGEVRVNNVFIDLLTSKTSLITRDKEAHFFEHSIEVQLPFIQKISPHSDIVPLTVKYGTIDQLKELAAAITETIRETGINATIVASTDMTHYEPRVLAEEKDKLAIEKILKLDPEGLISVVKEHDISMCGYIPTTLMLLCAGLMNAGKAELIKYTDSGETTGDTEQVVGYAGIVVF